jgi:hypothetical protein
MWSMERFAVCSWEQCNGGILSWYVPSPALGGARTMAAKIDFRYIRVGWCERREGRRKWKWCRGLIQLADAAVGALDKYGSTQYSRHPVRRRNKFFFLLHVLVFILKNLLWLLRQNDGVADFAAPPWIQLRFTSTVTLPKSYRWLLSRGN